MARKCCSAYPITSRNRQHKRESRTASSRARGAGLRPSPGASYRSSCGNRFPASPASRTCADSKELQLVHRHGRAHRLCHSKKFDACVSGQLCHAIEAWNRSLRISWTEANQESATQDSRHVASDDACSARSTVAIRSSIRVPVNISNVPAFVPGLGLVLFRLGRSGKTPPQNCGCRTRPSSQILYPARLTITAPGARQFLRSNSNSLPQTPRYTLSAARILALRDRGLRSISSSLAVTGFFVSSRY